MTNGVLYSNRSIAPGHQLIGDGRGRGNDRRSGSGGAGSGGGGSGGGSGSGSGSGRGGRVGGGRSIGGSRGECVGVWEDAHSITANESIGPGDGNWSDARWVRTRRRFLRSIWRIASDGSQMDSFVTRTSTSGRPFLFSLLPLPPSSSAPPPVDFSLFTRVNDVLCVLFNALIDRHSSPTLKPFTT